MGVCQYKVRKEFQALQQDLMEMRIPKSHSSEEISGAVLMQINEPYDINKNTSDSFEVTINQKTDDSDMENSKERDTSKERGHFRFWWYWVNWGFIITSSCNVQFHSKFNLYIVYVQNQQTWFNMKFKSI